MTYLDELSESLEDVDREVDRRVPSIVDELADFCRIPSETTHARPLRDASSWIAERMGTMGASVREYEVSGAPPLVVGEIGEGSGTVICLQHYDVQPADPIELWTSPPFEPEERDGRLFARGVFDNKGQLLLRLGAVEAYLHCMGRLPCRVRFIVEGEEESGSRHLAELLAQDPALVEADAVLNEAGYIDAAGRPLLTCGIRGLVYLELRVRTLDGDVHSGRAMLLPNAAWRLVRALGSMVDDEGAPAVRGIEDAVVPPTPAQLEHLRSTPFDGDGLLRVHGARGFVADRRGFDAQVSSVFSPTFNLSGISSGWAGPDVKTVIPAEASAKLDVRLVPNQDPGDVVGCVRRHLDEHGFDDIDVELVAAGRPWWTPVDAPLVDAARSATRAVHGTEPLRVISAMGSAPLHQVCAPRGLPAVGFGCGHPDHRAHAPDENIRIDALRTAMKVFARFVPGFASILDEHHRARS